MISELQQHVLDAARSRVSTLKTLADARDVDEVRSQARSLRRQATQMGLDLLAEAAKDLEEPTTDVVEGVRELNEALHSYQLSSRKQEEGSGNTFLFSDEKKLLRPNELMKMSASWNIKVFQRRVTDNFVEEQLLCQLYKQQAHQRTQAQKAYHREACKRNQQWSESLWTPYTRQKAQIRATLDRERRAKEESTPRFRDVDEVVTPRLNGMLLSVRLRHRPIRLKPLPERCAPAWLRYGCA